MAGREPSGAGMQRDEAIEAAIAEAERAATPGRGIVYETNLRHVALLPYIIFSFVTFGVYTLVHLALRRSEIKRDIQRKEPGLRWLFLSIGATVLVVIGALAGVQAGMGVYEPVHEHVDADDCLHDHPAQQDDGSPPRDEACISTDAGEILPGDGLYFQSAPSLQPYVLILLGLRAFASVALVIFVREQYRLIEAGYAHVAHPFEPSAGSVLFFVVAGELGQLLGWFYDLAGWLGLLTFIGVLMLAEEFNGVQRVLARVPMDDAGSRSVSANAAPA